MVSAVGCTCCICSEVALGIVVIFNIKTIVTLNVNDVAIIVILIRMRLTDAVASRRRHQRHAVIVVRACHKTPKIFCDKRTVPVSRQGLVVGLLRLHCNAAQQHRQQ